MKQPIRKLNDSRTSSTTRPLRRVVAALIVREEPLTADAGQTRALEVLICQRRPDQPMALKWEFPGGKIEEGETPEQALARELSEELGIDASIGRHITTIRHNYRNGGVIEIAFFTVTEYQGEMVNHIFQQMLWSPITALPTYDFLAADLTLIHDLADGKLL